jgi:hypothetical protein
MDTAQILLTIVIVVLSVLLLALGTQVFFILKEVRKTIQKTNRVLDNANMITESVSKPLSSLSTFATGIKISSVLAKILRGKKDDDGK